MVLSKSKKEIEVNFVLKERKKELLEKKSFNYFKDQKINLIIKLTIVNFFFLSNRTLKFY